VSAACTTLTVRVTVRVTVRACRVVWGRYALLTRMVAQCCNLKAGEFVHTIGDAHVYLNHRCALREQLARAPRPFPMLTIKDRADGPVTDIDGFQFSDFEITGYKPHGAIKMQMAV